MQSRPDDESDTLPLDLWMFAQSCDWCPSRESNSYLPQALAYAIRMIYRPVVCTDGY
ncbi:MAG: hypothetical protein JO189_15615 [Deltaproteobacteria bacterium]|nr:hypothetical protein [Deltaproteobacteria bacterium]